MKIFLSEINLHGTGELTSIVVRCQNVISMAVGEEERFNRSNSILLQVVVDTVYTSGGIYRRYIEPLYATKNDGRFQNDIDQYECVR